MFRCVLTGRAQEAYSAECGEENSDYEAVKAAVLKSYELVPQKFRNWAKGDKQTNVEFVRDLTSHFPACVVTRSQHCKNPTAELPRSGVCQEDGCSEQVVHLPDLPSSLSREDWVQQREGPSMSALTQNRSPQACNANLLEPYDARKAPVTGNPISQDLVVDPALTLDSVLSGPAVSGLGPASERHVEEPGDPVLIKMFSMLFGDAPMRTNLSEHDFDVGSNPPIKQYFYRCAAAKTQGIRS